MPNLSILDGNRLKCLSQKFSSVVFAVFCSEAKINRETKDKVMLFLTGTCSNTPNSQYVSTCNSFYTDFRTFVHNLRCVITTLNILLFLNMGMGTASLRDRILELSLHGWTTCAVQSTFVHFCGFTLIRIKTFRCAKKDCCDVGALLWSHPLLQLHLLLRDLPNFLTPI